MITSTTSSSARDIYKFFRLLKKSQIRTFGTTPRYFGYLELMRAPHMLKE